MPRRKVTGLMTPTTVKGQCKVGEDDGNMFEIGDEKNYKNRVINRKGSSRRTIGISRGYHLHLITVKILGELFKNSINTINKVLNGLRVRMIHRKDMTKVSWNGRMKPIIQLKGRTGTGSRGISWIGKMKI